MKTLLVLPMLLAFVLPACQHTPQAAATTASKASSETKAACKKLGTGLASIYTDHRTASGQRFRAGDLTAAHRTLPFGTRVHVKALGTGRDVIVCINDRGPYVQGRIIDLTPAAAARLGLTKSMGITKVEISQPL